MSIDTMQKYIHQTRALDSERSQLVKRLAANDILSLANPSVSLHDPRPKSDEGRVNEVDSILKRLEQIYQAQSSNAIVLADMLNEVLRETSR